ncbi:mobilization protein [Agrobacterium rhizogenes]|uniref:mobilization protein n=1 Tax=Rhizobium rhizogenes TaxID=359 RepID=UPI0022B65D1F|nr:mobilization protein [Rhizobium rhizogenes]MCZ7450962.1 mobilization protein [Rhizobium rhizogenes]
MRKPIARRIRELEEQERALQSRLDKQERAKATRRKILLGAFVLEQLERNNGAVETPGQNDLKTWLEREFSVCLGRDADRALFADLLDLSERTGG